MKQIELQHVYFSYNTHPVLEDITFSIESGEIVVIVGPNGGGKTTLLRLILGLETPTHGTVRLFDESPVKSRTRIGYVPQQTLYDPQFPVRVLDVVRMGIIERRPLGFFTKNDTNNAMEALEKMQLGEIRNAAFAELSGGQRQRVLIARSLVSSPEILMLDEPTAHVDTHTSHQLYQILKQLSTHMTILFVSHDLEVVSSIVTSVLCVNRTAKFHPTRDLTGDALRELYGSDMMLVRHDHRCCGAQEGGTHE